MPIKYPARAHVGSAFRFSSDFDAEITREYNSIQNVAAFVRLPQYLGSSAIQVWLLRLD
jgi:hypothetical protein